MKRFLLVPLLLVLGACAHPLQPSDMAVMPQVYNQLTTAPEFEKKIALGNIVVKENAGGMNATVNKENYTEALSNALLMDGLYCKPQNNIDPTYILDANLSDIDVPMFGFNMTATTTAHYRLYRKSDGADIINQTVKTPYEAKFPEAFDGAQRSRVAVAKSVRENVTHLLRVIHSK